MPAVAVLCPRCNSSIPEGELKPFALSRCSQCHDAFQMEPFPALFRRADPVLDAELVLVEGESTCFNHSDKKAVVPCKGCGRFLCSLCDCELRGEHFCPSCLEAGIRKGKIKNLENRRSKHDSVALALAIAPMLIFYFTIISAPAALYISIRHWNSPRSIIHRTKVRFVIAIILASLQICGWLFLMAFLIWALSGGTTL
jgi:hypothetical protein